MAMAAAQFAAYWRILEMVALVLVGVDPEGTAKASGQFMNAKVIFKMLTKMTGMTYLSREYLIPDVL